jgi:type II secretory pathway component PulF
VPQSVESTTAGFDAASAPRATANVQQNPSKNVPLIACDSPAARPIEETSIQQTLSHIATRAQGDDNGWSEKTQAARSPKCKSVRVAEVEGASLPGALRMSSRDDEGALPPRRPRPARSKSRPGGRVPDEGASTFRPAGNPPRTGGSSQRAEREPVPATGGPTWTERILFGSVSTAHLAQFSRQFAAYLDAGVDLVKSLDSLERQFARTALGPVIGRIALAVRRGDALAEAMAREPQAFDRLMLSLMRVAEARGGVPETLRLLANHYEARQRLLRQARSAMIYPVIVLVVASVVIGIIAGFVLPVMASLLIDLAGRDGGALPFPSRALIAISNFVQAMGWWAVPVVVVGLLILLRWAYQRPSGKAIMDSIALRIPVLGSLAAKVDTQRFARSLAALLDGGVDMNSSLSLASDVVHMEPFRRSLNRTREAVMHGTELSAALRDTHRFGHDVIAIVESGEETGKLPESLVRVADDYEEQVEYMVKNMGQLVQPVLMILLGGMVIFIILAVILPYVSMINNLTR